MSAKSICGGRWRASAMEGASKERAERERKRLKKGGWTSRWRSEEDGGSRVEGERARVSRCCVGERCGSVERS